MVGGVAVVVDGPIVVVGTTPVVMVEGCVVVTREDVVVDAGGGGSPGCNNSQTPNPVTIDAPTATTQKETRRSKNRDRAGPLSCEGTGSGSSPGIEAMVREQAAYPS